MTEFTIGWNPNIKVPKVDRRLIPGTPERNRLMNGCRLRGRPQPLRQRRRKQKAHKRSTLRAHERQFQSQMRQQIALCNPGL